MAAGLNYALTKEQMDRDYGGVIAEVRNSLDKLSRLYDTHWSKTGPTDYVVAGGSPEERDVLGSAITETMWLNEVRMGRATVAADGTVTLGTTGHGFDHFMAGVSGTKVI